MSPHRTPTNQNHTVK